MIEKPFDFDTLPPEVAGVLRDVLNWRIARDLSQDAIAEDHVRRLDDSSIEFRNWAQRQSELRALTDHQLETEALHDESQVKERTRVSANRVARQARIARGKLSSVPSDQEES